MVSGKITIWLGKELHEAAKKLNINISRTFREFLRQRLEESGVKIEAKESDLVLLVQCPKCSTRFQTSSTGVVKCPQCGCRFPVFTKRYGSRIKKILKGDRSMVTKLYHKRFGGTGGF